MTTVCLRDIEHEYDPCSGWMGLAVQITRKQLDSINATGYTVVSLFLHGVSVDVIPCYGLNGYPNGWMWRAWERMEGDRHIIAAVEFPGSVEERRLTLDSPKFNSRGEIVQRKFREQLELDGIKPEDWVHARGV